jgi:peroxiredoxin
MSEFEKHDAVVAAISVDPPGQSLELARAQGITFPLLSDPEGQALEAFGVRHTEGNPIDHKDIARPATFVADREGRIVWRDMTSNWRIRPRPETLLAELERIP